MPPSDIVVVEVAHKGVAVNIGEAVTGYVRLLGWSARETSGAAPAFLDLHDGEDGNSPCVAGIGLPANSGSAMWLGPEGVHLRNGLYQVTNGAITGSVYVCVADD